LVAAFFSTTFSIFGGSALAGTPTRTVLSGMSPRTTTAPAPVVTFLPSFTGATSTVLEPVWEWSPIVVGFLFFPS
jgi:hypothetical protein